MIRLALSLLCIVISQTMKKTKFLQGALQSFCMTDYNQGTGKDHFLELVKIDDVF